MVRLSLVLLGMLSGVSAAAGQTIIVTRPGLPPVDCSQGCAIVVTQPETPTPPTCTYTVSPQSASPSAAATTVPVSVTASAASCTWTATSQAAWLTLTTPTASAVTINVAANAGAARTGTATVAGVSVTITQAAGTTPPEPPGTILARVTCTAENFPGCGHGYWGTKDGTTPGVYRYHTVERVGNGARFRMTPGSEAMQFYLGWQPSLGASTAEHIYIRYRLTINQPLRANGNGDVWNDKFIIANNGGQTRAIGELKPQHTSDLTDMTLAIGKNIEYGDQMTPRIRLTIGQTYAVQMRLSRGNAVRFAQWLNNPVQASPSSESGTFAFNVANWQNVGIGFYSNATLAVGGTVDFTVTDIEIGTAFDPAFGATKK